MQSYVYEGNLMMSNKFCNKKVLVVVNYVDSTKYLRCLVRKID